MKVVAFALFALFGAVAATGLKGPEACSICKFAFGVLEDKLQNNKTEASVISELENLCHELPTAVQGECKQLVITYGSELIKVIDHITPTQFCDEIHLCTAQVKALKTNGEVCNVCQSFLRYIRNLLGDKKTRAEIEAELQTVCLAVPAAIRSKCDSMVKVYGEKIINFLVKEEDPLAVCKEMRLCPSTLTRRLF